MTMLYWPSECRECGARDDALELHHSVRGAADIVDGRHRTNEMQVHVHLGCLECSTTVATWTLEEFLAEIDDDRKQTKG